MLLSDGVFKFLSILVSKVYILAINKCCLNYFYLYRMSIAFFRIAAYEFESGRLEYSIFVSIDQRFDDLSNDDQYLL